MNKQKGKKKTHGIAAKWKRAIWPVPALFCEFIANLEKDHQRNQSVPGKVNESIHEQARILRGG